MVSIDDAHATLLGNRQLQFDFRQVAPPPPPAEPFHVSLGAAGTIPIWILAGLAALVVLALTIRYLRRRPRPQAETAAPPAAVPAIPVRAARLALGDADRLAAGGRFLAAAHVLLGCGVEEIARFHPALLRPAHTSRDIAALAGLPDGMRRAFGRIAAIVEVGLFGGGALDAADYAACREAFVTSALAGRA